MPYAPSPTGVITPFILLGVVEYDKFLMKSKFTIYLISHLQMTHRYVLKRKLSNLRIWFTKVLRLNTLLKQKLYALPHRICSSLRMDKDGAYAAKLILKDLIIFASYCLNIILCQQGQIGQTFKFILTVEAQNVKNKFQS